MVVRETMSRLGLTQASVTERGGPSDTTLRKILDNEPVGISPTTLKKIDDAFGWDPGSAAATLAGGTPTVSGIIRGRSGRPIQSFQAIEGAEQEELELLRLATIVIDARDLVRSQSGPLMTALAAVLDEATELVTRQVARSRSDDLEDAQWFISEARAANTIRRKGDTYVLEKHESAPRRSAAFPESNRDAHVIKKRDAGSSLRDTGPYRDLTGFATEQVAASRDDDVPDFSERGIFDGGHPGAK
ncbi:hypothetical protein BST24_08455 [Mycobacteroides franklinii]|nr:hypothetical protein BST24_08455 [Mycobacteroides franklinii]